ncbi:MAG: hypothetical protein KDA42_16550, partial [Planctomycetales bacterium]|nr:hypothetical protein [Planctomycetales bacterium]
RAVAPLDLPPSIAATRAADLGIPLYTVVFGQPASTSQARDIAIEELLVSPTVYVKNQLDVLANVHVRGYSGKELVARLLYEVEPGKMQPVASQRVTPDADGGAQPVRFRYAPATTGEHKLSVEIAAEPGELVTTNNRSSTYVTVLEGGLNVLYLASGYPREQRDIRWSLAESPDIQIVAQYLGSLPRDRERWPLELTGDLRPDRFDAILVGDVDANTFSAASWQAVADAVETGAGFLMHGGFHSFGPGGFGESPLANVLPITIERLERQNFDEPPSSDLHIAGPLRLRPAAAAGDATAILSLGPADAGDDLFSRLPPLDGANRFRGLKRNAVVLAQSDGQPAAPLLVASSYGNGRVLALAVDSTYRWIEGGFDTAHRRFWRQAILWLARKDETSRADVWVKLNQRRFRPAAQVAFTAGLGRFQQASDTPVDFRADVVLPDGSRQTIAMARGEGGAGGTVLETAMPGEYTIEVVAARGENTVGTARARFQVFEQDLELDDPAANPALLASLAGQTSHLGGRAIAAEELPDLLRQLAANPPDLDIATEVRKTYWDTWPVLLLFIALLSVEWYLRKRWGLV